VSNAHDDDELGGAGDMSGVLHVSVEDNGIGIPAEALSGVFESFYQVCVCVWRNCVLGAGEGNDDGPTCDASARTLPNHF